MEDLQECQVAHFLDPRWSSGIAQVRTTGSEMRKIQKCLPWGMSAAESARTSKIELGPHKLKLGVTLNKRLLSDRVFQFILNHMLPCESMQV